MNRWKKIAALALATGAVLTGAMAPVSANAATETKVLEGVCKDPQTNQWHLYVQDTPTAAHGRGLGQAKVYTQDGELVACMTQEAMIRVPEEDLKK